MRVSVGRFRFNLLVFIACFLTVVSNDEGADCAAFKLIEFLQRFFYYFDLFDVWHPPWEYLTLDFDELC